MSAQAISPPASKLRPSLRFRDAHVEREFQEQYLRDNLGYIRAGLILGMAAGAFLAFVSAPPVGQERYLVLHLVGISLTTLSLGLTFAPGYARWWQLAIVGLVVASTALTQMHRVVVRHPADWTGVVGLMMILAFAFSLFRLQYVYAAIASVLAIAFYNAMRGLAQAPGDIGLVQPDVYLVTFATVGTVAAFALERFARLLFLRERDLGRERERGDALLRNVMPGSIVERLKLRAAGTDDGRIAERYVEATVLFADLVGFTERAALLEPDQIIDTLDDVFGRWDELADRYGLEKIKTIGDAYMAVAGVPDVRPDHVEAAADMALAVRESVAQLRWPGGVPIELRIGMACGPVVAGVIGHRKFAYDVWGDTVNAASRLESAAKPGTIQVSESVSDRVGETYRFSEPYVVELKGKGPTTVRALLGRPPTENGPVAGPALVRARGEGDRWSSMTG